MEQTLITFPTMKQVIAFFGWGDSLLALSGVSLVLALCAVFFLVVVGFFMNLAEKAELCILRKSFGWSFASFFHNRLTFPGLVMHECAHAAFAMITGSKVTEISIFDDGRESIGHIQHILRGPKFWRAVQSTLVSCAPTAVGLWLGAFMLKWILYGNLPLWGDAILWYLEVCILNHISMSTVDLGYYISSVWVFILPFFGLFLTLGLLA